jgi:hypothetical protein
MNWYTHMHICVHYNVSRSSVHKYSTCTSYACSHSTMQYDTWGSLYYSTKIHTLQKPNIRIMVGAETYKFILWCSIPIGVADHKCMFIQLSITHNKQLVNVFWQLVSALTVSHHQANTREQRKQKLCITLWWWSPPFQWKTHCKCI